MPTYDRENKPPHWIWLLAVLILAVLVFFSFRRGLLTSSHEAQPKSGTEPHQPPASPLANQPSDGVPQPSRSASGQPAAPPSPASGDWYTTVAFKGHVLNEANRMPVDGATVRICAYSSPSSVVEKITSATGAFQVVAPPAYRYGVKVEAEGFRSYQDDSFVVTRPYYDLEIMLTPTLTLRGRVVDEQSVGISDALVQLQRGNDRSSAFLSATTDPEGVFTFTDVPRFGRCSLEAFHPGFDTLGMVNVVIPPEGDVVIRMKPTRAAGSLSGTVTDTARRPLAGARVYLFDPSDGRLMSTIRTDRQGLYKFARMREGYYLVRCTADGSAEGRSNQEIIAIYANKEARLDFSLDPGLQIRGVVVNEKTEPVIQAEVRYGVDDTQRTRAPAPDAAGAAGRLNIRSATPRIRNLGVTTTDNEGRFQISGLSDGQYQVAVSHRDYQSIVARLRPSNQPQTLVLDAGLSLRGTISDARGAAVERFTLTLQSTSGKGEKAYPFTTTDGHFEIHGLARDVYQVSLQTSGRGRLSGTLDLQAPAEVFVVLDAGRGGRGQNSLNFLKAK